VTVDKSTFFQLKCMEFDKRICEAKEGVARLEKEKASYVYEQNMQIAIKGDDASE
jgi:hypothetical protein